MRADWAFVVGINDYPDVRDGTLPHCVDDAIDVARWLLDENGGGLPPQHVYLLLQPMPGFAGQPLEFATRMGKCDHATFMKAVEHLIEASLAKGERLFFYFSGHGFSFREGRESYREALAFSDFSRVLTERSISIESLVERFAATQIANQFYFFDCCRDVLELDPERRGRTIVSAGRFSYVEEPADRRPVQYFPFYATQPGKPAAQLSGQRPRSQFTRFLVDGLKGAECAKIWDPQSERYIVRQSRLFKYLLDKLQNAPAALPGGGRQVPQMRSQIGTPGLDPDPVLASYKAESIMDERWDISVVPDDVFVKTEFRYQRAFLQPVKVEWQGAAPIRLNVPPQLYVLHAEVPGYLPAPESGWKKASNGWVTELYQPTHTKAGFRPIDKTATAGLSPAAGGGKD
jgi:hypothetical protein